eukprot:CAMPEP_0172182854 /NCGR_PEP_ID=MMETSP1050-20130122/18637_1 /TAXON_ID=233186 /ORGANISM="Cryptomonas curvata, Strain CCAP979/52" /LENGTH=43 /DNA_ID= /DNA_START= /DNA_END= /DNA_ORIENTATION=
MRFTGITDVLNHGRCEDGKGNAASGACCANGVASHVSPMGLEA